MHTPTRSATVIGAGYVGLVTAVGLAGIGQQVRLVEAAPGRLAMLRRGRSRSTRPGCRKASMPQSPRACFHPSSDPHRPGIRARLRRDADRRGRPQRSPSDRRGARGVAPRLGPSDIVVIRSTLPVRGTWPAVRDAGLPTIGPSRTPNSSVKGRPSRLREPDARRLGRFSDGDPDALDDVLLCTSRSPARVSSSTSRRPRSSRMPRTRFALKLSFTNEVAEPVRGGRGRRR